MRDRISRIEADIMALEMLLLRVAAGDGGAPGAEASVLKIRGSEIQQDLAMLQMEVAGPDCWPYDPDWMLAGADWHGPGRRWRLPPARATPTCARPRSTAAPRKCRRASSRATRWGCDIRMLVAGCSSAAARRRKPGALLPQGKPRMDFIYTEEQRMLADSLRRLVAQD